MKELLKKLTIRNYIQIVVFISLLVAFILSLVSNAVFGYAIQNFALVVVCSIAALLVVAGCVCLKLFSKEFIADFLGIAVVVLAIVAGIIVMASRAELVGTLWVTALDSVNPMANRAMNTGFPSFVIYVVSAVLFTVSAFMKDKEVA